MKRLLFTLVFGAWTSAVHAGGIDLTWTDCVGSGNEEAAKCFRCSGTTDETYDLVLAFQVATATCRLPCGPSWRGIKSLYR